VAKIDFRDVLNWVVLSPDSGRSPTSTRPANYKYPIPSQWDTDHKGRYLRLSRLWDLAATQPGLFESHFRDRLRPVLLDHGIDHDVIAEIIEPLGQLIVTLVGIKQSKVSYLQLAPFTSDVFSEEVYNDAIVNIGFDRVR
jgi:hypothetical protein